MNHKLIFLKLGGSLITDKNTPRTARLDVIQRLANEIKNACTANPHLRILLGHGSGSFGHQSARMHNTRKGVQTPQEWKGFIEVWKDARALNQVVMDGLTDADLPAIAFPPSAIMLARDGAPEWFEARPLLAALENGLLPVVQGDVAFDSQRGGTILSTEQVFVCLARALKPQLIILAGIEPGVWRNFPETTQIIEKITPDDLLAYHSNLAGSASVDVTGGMREKVALMLELIRVQPSVSAAIISGDEPGSVEKALLGQPAGTLLHSDP